MLIYVDIWRSPDGKTKNEIDYIMTDKPNMITYIRFINRINIGSDNRMLVSNIRVDTERKKLLRKKKPQKVDTREIGIKKDEKKRIPTATEKQVHCSSRTG